MNPSSPNQNQPVVGAEQNYTSPGPQPVIQDVVTPQAQPIFNNQVPAQQQPNPNLAYQQPQQSVQMQNVQMTNSQLPVPNPIPQPQVSVAAYQNPNPKEVQSLKKTSPKSNPNSTQNTLQIAEVRDGLVIMNDGSFRAVAMFRSINFDLMAPEEREAVEFSYQGFLNSLFFPVQISLHSQKVDLGPYLEKLSKIRNEHDNMLLALLMDDYIQYMANMSDQVNIMDKKFYVVIPYEPNPDTQKAILKSLNFFSGIMKLFSKKEAHVVVNEDDLTKAKTELKDRIQLVLSGLNQCGVQGVPLDTKELIELYYDSYNPDTATHQALKNTSDLTASIVGKGVGNAFQPNLDKEMF